ncbi:PQQ-binding-like beta-propeller repeat protein [Dactylosporangium sp. NPDC051541]|uniref:outer membrane protein assembly factor BamB family protein n=1 Tax=Dactylosporangium sp. NPDC051541 TaxID=3363977 RepID=UPI0037BC1FBC
MAVLGRAVAVGGAFLLVATIWLTTDIGSRSPSGPLWPVGEAAAVLVAVYLAAQDPASGRIVRLVRFAAVASAVAAVVSWFAADDPGAGPFWPAMVTGSVLMTAGLVVLGLPAAAALEPAGRWWAAGGVVLAFALPVAAVAVIVPVQRGADIAVVPSAPIASWTAGEHLGLRWSAADQELDGVVAGAAVPVFVRGNVLTGLDPASGERRWRADFRYPRNSPEVVASGEELVVRWERGSSRSTAATERHTAVLDARTGRVRLDLADVPGQLGAITLPGLLVRQICPAPSDGGEAHLEALDLTTGDKVWSVATKAACERSIRYGESLLGYTGDAIQRIDGGGTIRWTHPMAAGDGLLRDQGADDAVVLFHTLGFTVLDLGTGAERWRDDRLRRDEFAGLGDAAIVAGSKTRPFTLTARSLRDGTTLWTRETAFDPEQFGDFAPLRSVFVYAGAVTVLHNPKPDRPREGRAAARFSLRDGEPLPVDTVSGSGAVADLGDAPKFAGGLLLTGSRSAGPGVVAIG